MSLQSNGLRGMDLRSVSGITAGFGSLLLAAAFAYGADVEGPPAEGFKTLLPNKTLLTDKKKLRDVEGLVDKIIRGTSLTGNEAVFEAYFVTYLFPQWTQTTEKSLNLLPKERDKFLKDVELSG